ncbi:hypothetical protein EMIHUDRAFT_222031 [Emiliania huxleyi CCMP1516]|uniref:AMP-dependent synthetase/ligase domain-containing protein n=2 Tax=Emiliania huxleyi TaxID=2903 RepID=A0A0D3KZ15_EMIH1|nr:hypothetical protein EMIHUDRAFT_222031 [Emiliania huxleyi CCMP1516]EOD41000.1 hypothetical protein EMIHUDRAFT_222031 [Emiliania huxleyi CCMP1516]|eukprot:XP_005793429.1 hypothetical protein EMIHUDRAFT_222031 [Emiliania huxleyi CCMP1516]
MGTTLVDQLLHWSSTAPDSVAFRWLRDDGSEEAILSFAALETQTSIVSSRLMNEWLVGKGERALLVYLPGLAFISAFLGCLRAGVVAVPIYPPDPAHPEKGLDKMDAHARCAKPAVALTEKRLSAALRGAWVQHQTDVPSTQQPFAWYETDDASDDAVRSLFCGPLLIDEEALAFIQFTSGSTGTPKGVSVTHKQLRANLTAMGDVLASPSRDAGGLRFCCWLPQYHDLGLIGNIAFSIVEGASCTLMSPASFVKRPVRWLEAISYYSATHIFAPNFAFELCARKVRDEQLGRLDLSCVMSAVNGAEPLRPSTMHRFLERFGPCGFRLDAYSPGYGCAENVLVISVSLPNQPALEIHVARESLTRGCFIQLAVPSKSKR